MQLIWHNAQIGEYQIGNSEDYGTLQSQSELQDDLTLLMELPVDDRELANKVMLKLNKASKLQPNAMMMAT